MATDFYKVGKDYFNAGDNSKISNTTELTKLSKAGGKPINAPTSALKPASVAPAVAPNKDINQVTTGYDKAGQKVFVKPGEYNPGISFTNPTILTPEQKKATEDANSGQDATIKKSMETSGDLPNVKNSISEDQAILDEYGSKFGYDKNTDKPKATSMVDEYAKLQKTYDTASLENSLTDLQKEQKDIEAATRARKDYEASKAGVSMGVISGKQSEIEKQQAELLDANLRKQDYINSQLKNKYSTIETMMNLKQTDYTNSVASYDKQFSQNMQVMNYLQGVENSVNTKANQVRDDARANLTIITNAITSGGMKYDELPVNTKNQISKYEVMAGLPTGFTQALQNKNPKADILSTTTRQEGNGNKYADVLLRDQSGKITVHSVLLGKEKITGTNTGLTQQEKDERELVANLKKDAADWITKLDEKDSDTETNYKYDWGTAYDSMMTKYGSDLGDKASQLIDKMLGGGYDQASGEWKGRANRPIINK